MHKALLSEERFLFQKPAEFGTDKTLAPGLRELYGGGIQILLQSPFKIPKSVEPLVQVVLHQAFGLEIPDGVRKRWRQGIERQLHPPDGQTLQFRQGLTALLSSQSGTGGPLFRRVHGLIERASQRFPRRRQIRIQCGFFAGQLIQTVGDPFGFFQQGFEPVRLEKGSVTLLSGLGSGNRGGQLIEVTGNVPDLNLLALDLFEDLGLAVLKNLKIGGLCSEKGRSRNKR